MIMMTFATQPKCLPVTKVFFIKRTGKLHQRAVRLGQLDRDVKLLHERDVASSGSGDALRILQGRLLDVVALVNNVAVTPTIACNCTGRCRPCSRELEDSSPFFLLYVACKIFFTWNEM